MKSTLTYLAFVAALGVSPALSAEKKQASRPVLRDQLLSMLAEDLAPPKAIKVAAEEATPSDADAATDLVARHDRHRAKLSRLLDNIGWPNRDLVGADGERAALELLQAECTDTALLQRAVHLLNAAVAREAASKVDLARLVDASRVGQGRLQLYGTQYSQALDGRPVRFPIEDLDRVDERRKLAGLSTLHEQEVEMALARPLPTINGRTPPGSPIPDWWRSSLRMSGIEPAKGLNCERYPRLGMIYIHSRDDPRAPDGERPPPSASGLGRSKLDTSGR